MIHLDRLEFLTMHADARDTGLEIADRLSPFDGRASFGKQAGLIGVETSNSVEVAVVPGLLDGIGRWRARTQYAYRSSTWFHCADPIVLSTAAATKRRATTSRTPLAASLLDSLHRPRLLAHIESLDVPLCTAGPIHLGPPEHWAGLLRRSMGDLDGAIEQLQSAADSMDRIGARGYHAMAQAELAATLDQRGAPGDRGEARQLAGVARITATDLSVHAAHHACAHLA